MNGIPNPVLNATCGPMFSRCCLIRDAVWTTTTVVRWRSLFMVTALQQLADSSNPFAGLAAK